MCFLDVPSLLFDEQGGKTNTVGEKINPSILIQLHKKGGNIKQGGFLSDELSGIFSLYHNVGGHLELIDWAERLSKYYSPNLLGF